MSNINESFKQLFLGLYKMVVADGETDPREMAILYELGRDYGITNDEINDAIVNNKGIELYNPDSIEDKVRFLYIMAQIAWANEVIDPEERELLKETAKRFNFEEENLDGIVDYLISKAKENVAVEDIINEINND